jgi:hypothetical protein
MRPSEKRALAALWRFSARYVHLLSDPDRRPVDVGDVRVMDVDERPVAVSSEPIAGHLWLRGSLTPDGRRVLHIVDLLDQEDAMWTQRKRRSPMRRLSVSWSGLRSPVAASPFGRSGDAVPLRALDRSASPTRWLLPPFRRWLVLAEERER